MKKLNNVDFQLKPKSWLKANLNTTATRNLAIDGELHYTTDTKELFINNGTENVQIPTLEDSSQSPWSGTITAGQTITVVNGVITNVV